MYFQAHVDDMFVRWFDPTELEDIGVEENSEGRLVVTDTTTGETAGFTCTNKQAAAVFAMMLDDTLDMYEVVGPMFKGVLGNLCPIP